MCTTPATTDLSGMMQTNLRRFLLNERMEYALSCPHVHLKSMKYIYFALNTKIIKQIAFISILTYFPMIRAYLKTLIDSMKTIIIIITQELQNRSLTF